MAQRWPKRAPRQSQKRPKTGPRAPQSAPGAAQEGSKRRLFGTSPYVIISCLFVFLWFFCLPRPVPFRIAPGDFLTFMLAPFGPKFGQLEANFCATSTRFLHFLL